MSHLKAAVIGTGFIGPVHAEALQRAGVEVVGILGSTAQKSNVAAQKLRLATGYASLDELLADDAVNVVHIASPNRFHFEQAERSLRAGKHVVCEKPLAMNTSQTSKLVRLAQESNLAAAVNYNIRYYPLCLEAASQINLGNLGQIFHVAASYTQDWLFHPTDYNWRVQSKDGGDLRAIADIGTHALDLLQFITGKRITSVFADLQTFHTQRQRPLDNVQTFGAERGSHIQSETIPVTTEDYGCLMLRMGDQTRGVLQVSQVTAGHKNALRFEIAGSKKSLAWCSESPNALHIGHRDEPNQTLIRDPALMGEAAARASAYPGGHNEGFSETFKQLFRDIYRSIEGGQYLTSPSFPSFADGHVEVAICEAVLESHRKQQWVHLGEPAK